MVEFLLGFLWGTFVEWLVHRYILHDLALRIKARFHIEHHVIVARENGSDHDYLVPLWRSKARLKELVGLAFLALVHVPVIFISPMFFVGNIAVIVAYYFLHYMSHRYVAFGRKYMPWHMKHHLVTAKGNFGVIIPLWDHVFGTTIQEKR